MNQVLLFVSSALLLGAVTCDVSHILVKEEYITEPPPPRPYAFGYAAGRYAGHIDRTHSEVSDGSGVVKGSYSYVDPRHQIRTVDYIADKNGFHPILSHGVGAHPQDTAAVAAAKQRHFQQYAAIANHHQAGLAVVPVDSVAVAKAKINHEVLFQKIAEDHARIGAERKAEQLARGIEDPNALLEEHY